jgi:hypothetical protein
MRYRNIPEWSLLTAAGQQFGPQTLMTEFMHSSKRPRPINDEQQQQLEIASKSLNFEDWERMRFHERPIAIDEDFCIDDQLLSHNNSKSSSK